MNSKSLDVLIVHPNFSGVYGELAKKGFPAIEPPFPAAVSADFYRNQGHGVAILDANLERLSPEETAQRIKNYNPKLVSIIGHGQQPSDSTHMMHAIGEVSQLVDGEYPIILSGNHASALPERTLRETPGLKFVAIGEEHRVVDALLQSGLNSNNFAEIPGLAYIDNGEFHDSRKSIGTFPLANLNNELLGVAWDLLPDLKNYRAHNWHAYFDDEDRSPYASIYTSLGCPFKCGFCVINVGYDQSGKRDIRYWDSDNMIKKIDDIAEKGVKHVKFIDEMFVLESKGEDKRDINKFLDRMIERDYKFNIWAYARIDTVKNQKMLDRLKAAGVNWLVLGIESANADVRKDSRKGGFSNDKIDEHVRNVRNAGIHILGNYMVGLPNDTLDTMQETFDMVMKYREETLWMNVYSAVAYPGTPDHAMALQKGIISKDYPTKEQGGWNVYAHHHKSFSPTGNENLTPEESLRFRDNMFNAYFSDRTYLEFVRRQFGDNAVAHLESMTKTKLQRDVYKNPEVLQRVDNLRCFK